MRKILLIVIGVIGMFLTACDDDKEMSLSDIPIRLSGKILGMDEGEALARFRGGAGVGVYIIDASERQTGDLLGARVSNKKFMQSADGLVGDPLVYWNRERVCSLLSLFAGEWNTLGGLFISGCRTTGFFAERAFCLW